MTQALYTSQTGMNGAQTKLNVVADNIANMNTVGFKQSRVNFADIYYNTLSSGSAPSSNLGGINPRQIGTGVRAAEIIRDFTGGSSVATGISTNLAIKGNGFFTVQNGNNELLYTRAGNFSVDAEGYLVLPNGYKALGTEDQRSSTGSQIPIKIPVMIQTQTIPNAGAGGKTLSELNGNVAITSGTIEVVVGGQTTPVNIDANSTLNDVVAAINGVNGVTATLTDGKIDIKADDGSQVVLNNGTSNFVTQTGLTWNDATGSVESKTLDYQQIVRTGTDVANSQKVTAVDIHEDGILEVTYANGDKLTAIANPDDETKLIFRYTTGSPAVNIMGDDLDITGVAEPANFQLQMANFVNPDGLVAVGSNAYKEGPNSGSALYGSISAGAFGTVNSGEYEGSNVDLAEQFADMIISQRMLEANSRVFNTASNILQTISYLGQ